MFTTTPDLTIKFSDGRIVGLLSKREYASADDAEKRERQLYDLAVSLLGRQLSHSELHRGRADNHPHVGRRSWPTEIRYAGITVTSADAPLTQEQRLRDELRRLREKSAAERMTPRESLLADLIQQTEAKLAAMKADAEKAEHLEEVKTSEGFRRRIRRLDVYRVVAGFDPAAPTFEQIAVDEMSRFLSEGDFVRFDKIASPFESRIEARQIERTEALTRVVEPAMASINATNALLNDVHKSAEITDELLS